MLLRPVMRWHRHRLKGKLNRLGPVELDVLRRLLRLRAHWPRRWWWVEEWETVRVIGG